MASRMDRCSSAFRSIALLRAPTDPRPVDAIAMLVAERLNSSGKSVDADPCLRRSGCSMTRSLYICWSIQKVVVAIPAHGLASSPGTIWPGVRRG